MTVQTTKQCFENTVQPRMLSAQAEQSPVQTVVAGVA